MTTDKPKTNDNERQRADGKRNNTLETGIRNPETGTEVGKSEKEKGKKSSWILGLVLHVICQVEESPLQVF